MRCCGLLGVTGLIFHLIIYISILPIREGVKLKVFVESPGVMPFRQFTLIEFLDKPDVLVFAFIS